MKLDHQLIPYIRINSKSTKDLNASLTTITIMEENIISDVYHSNFLLIYVSPWARGTKEKKSTNRTTAN